MLLVERRLMFILRIVSSGKPVLIMNDVIIYTGFVLKQTSFDSR